MVWRAWTFWCGAPLGVLAAWALDRSAGITALGLGALTGGTLLVLLAGVATRLGDSDLERGWHLAVGATWTLASIPALVAVLLGLGPGAPWLLLLGAAAALAGILHGARRRGPAPGGAGWVGAAAVVLLASSLVVAGLGALAAALSPALPPVSEQRAAAVYDADASIVTQPLPVCRPRVSRFRVLLDHGAHPRLAGGDREVWFDAKTGNGTRQVHRLSLDSGRETCWTCDQPGSNQRPAPQRRGRSLIFDSDRDADFAEPDNTELYLTSAVGSPRPARRISFHPGADDHAFFSDSGVVVWSRGWGGSYDVVAATIRSGHGARFLGTPGRLFRGGTHWTIPLGWSPDQRHLVVADGQPLRPLRVSLLDPATDATRKLTERVAPGSAASFVADGGWMLLASTKPAGAGSLLPSWLGFLLVRLSPGLADDGRFRTTHVQMGEPGGDGEEVELGELASWGRPTGLSSDLAGRSFVLGQRRQTNGKVDERLVEVELGCS